MMMKTSHGMTTASSLVWDATGDGVVDSKDFLRTFDKDNDGNLNAQELDHLGHELSTQLDFNNQLLRQMQALEEAKLKSQRDMKSMHDKNQRLLNTIDELKSDLTETKRKLRVSHEIVENTTRQSKEFRGDNISIRQDLDATRKELEELKNTHLSVQEEYSKMERKVLEHQEKESEHKESLERVSSSTREEIEALNKSKDQLNSMLYEVRKKVTPLGVENKELKLQVDELKTSLSKVTSNESQEKSQREVAENNLKQVLLQMDKLKEEMCGMKFKMNGASSKEASLLKQCEEAEARAKSLVSRIDASEREVVSIKNQIDQVNEEKEALRHEIASLHHDLDTLSQQRQNENDIWAEKYVNLQEEMVSAQEELKANFKDSLTDAKRRITSAVEERRIAEEKLQSAQEDIVSLHDTMDNMRKDHEEAVEKWKQSKGDLEDLVISVRRQSSAKDAEIEKLHMELTKQRETSRVTIKELKEDLEERSSNFVEVLGHTQTMISALKRQVLDNRSEYGELSNQTQLLHKFCSQLHERNSKSPLRRIEPELEKVFETLFEKLSVLRQSNEGVHDDMAVMQVSLEEERNRSLLCEEEISRLEHHISTLEQEKINEVGKYKQQLDEMRSKVEDAFAERDDVIGRHKRVQATLDAATQQNKSLQTANNKLHDTIRSHVSSKSQTLSSSSEQYEKIEQLKTLNSELERGKDEMEKSMNSLTNELKTLKASIEPLQAENRSLSAEIQKKNEEMQAKIDSQSKSMAKVQATVQQYKQQLQSTQEVMSVVQAQNSELHAQNIDLHTEIERLHGIEREERPRV